MALIKLEIREDRTVLTKEETQKLNFIISYIDKLGVHEASKLYDLEQTIKDIISKVIVPGGSLSFKKNLLNFFLISKYDFPKDINKIDEANVRLLKKTTSELHQDSIVPALKEFEDPYLQGNQASYSKEFIFIENALEAQVLLPSRGNFQGGVFFARSVSKQNRRYDFRVVSSKPAPSSLLS